MQRNFKHLASFAIILFLGFSYAYAQTAFITPDLRWAGLKGHVKSVIETYDYGEYQTYIEYCFSKDGKLTYYYSEDWDDKAKIARNKSGRIYKIFTDDDVEHYAITYKYNQNGYVLSTEEEGFQSGREEKFVLNESGWPVQSKSEEYVWAGRWEYDYNRTNTFQYNKKDSQGNWVRCTLKSTLTYTNCPDYDPADRNYQVIITRKITYWQ
jgi:hypothetical protein